MEEEEEEETRDSLPLMKMCNAMMKKLQTSHAQTIKAMKKAHSADRKRNEAEFCVVLR